MPSTRRVFTDEFKREAVKLVKQPEARVAQDLGLEQSMLLRWVSQEHGGVMDIRPHKSLRSESASARTATGHRGHDIFKNSARLLCSGLQ